MRNKKGRFANYFFILFSLLAYVLFPSLVYAQETDNQVGFTEDFEGEPLEGWELSPDAIVTEGYLRLYGGNSAMKIGGWGDQTTQLRIQFSSFDGELMVHYFSSDRGSYNLIFTPEMIILEKVSGPEDVLHLSDSPYQRAVNTWMNIEIQVENGEHRISIDNQEILSTSDPEPLQPGGIGFHYFGPDTVDIDHINLVSLGQPEESSQQNQAEEPAPTPPVTSETTGSRGGFLETIQGLFDTQSSQVDFTTFVINLALAALLAYILGRVYIYWGGSLSNRRKFAANFMLMTVTTTFIILVVRSSVALSLGLVGALSIVRFRTAVKEPEELAYLFFAIGIGIGLGDNQRTITLVAFGVAILIIGLLRLFRQRDADVNLHLTISSNNAQSISLEQLMSAIQPFTAKLKLLRLDETDQTLEASFLVEFKHIDNLNQAKAAIQAIEPQAAITFLDNKGIW
jgi:hypothetical protein